MTTKKTTTKASAEKKTATKAAASKTSAAKKTTTKKAAATKAATAVAEKTAEAIAPTVTEKLVATMMMSETPETAVEMEAVVAKAAPQTTEAPVAATQKKIVLTIGMLQKRLTDLGIYDGAWDGVYGPMTKHAVARFQAKNGLAVNGDSNPETLKALGLDLYKTY